MSVTFNELYHRNPSGCHNKVKYLLKICKHNINNFKVYINLFVNTATFNGLPVNQDKAWEEAITITKYILDKDSIGLPEYLLTKYPWIHKELPGIPIWHNLADERPEADRRVWLKIDYSIYDKNGKCTYESIQEYIAYTEWYEPSYDEIGYGKLLLDFVSNGEPIDVPWDKHTTWAYLD